MIALHVISRLTVLAFRLSDGRASRSAVSGGAVGAMPIV
jgi:hypothetical protein